jgi:HEAT repeat protein
MPCQTQHKLVMRPIHFAGLPAAALILGCLSAWVSQINAADSACYVNWTQGYLTVTARGVPLEKVLTKVSNETNVEFSGSTNGCGPTNVEFSGLSLQKGMEKLLTGLNYAIVRSRPINERAGRMIVLILGCNRTSASAGERQPSRKPEAAGPDAALLHGNMIERVSELNSFAEQGNWDALDKLAAGGDPSTETLALELLSRHDGDEAARLAVAALHTKDQSRQLAGIQVLNGLDRPDAARALEDALSSDDVGVRESAVRGLMGQTGPEAIDALTHALQDRDPAIRMMALTVLSQRGEAGAAGMETALHNSDPAVRARAGQLLDDAISQ